MTLILTVDRLNDLKANEWTECYDIIEPEKIINYAINDNKGKTLAKGWYWFLFGFRIGIHKDCKTMRLIRK